MPLYEYQCPKCGLFELIRKFSDDPVSICPTCGSEVQKLASAPAFHLKGTGWYVTDYAKKGTGEAKSGKDNSADGKSGDGGKTADGGKSAESKPAESKSSESKSEAKGSKESTATATTPKKSD